MKKDEYFWIVGGGLLQVPLISEVRKLDLKIIVSDLSKDCACRDIADIFVNLDIFDIDGHIREAQSLVGKGMKIVGVLAAGIDAPETMARLCKHLGLPSVEPDIAYLVHNKHLFRERLKELGYPVPQFKAITRDNFSELENYVEAIGFPLIVKNTDSSGSRGTKIFYEKDLEGIRSMVNEAIRVSKSAVALLEECWEGPEQTVETLIDIEGNFHPCFITDRLFDRTSGYAIELGLRQPSALPKKTQDEMFDIAKNVASALGVKMGAAKFDMILTKNGPRIIEMTVRLSGGFDCQYLVPAATGKKVMMAAILTALGQKFSPEMLHDSKKRVGLSESIWPNPGKIVAINGVEHARQLPGVEHIFFRQKVGDKVEPYTDCTKRVCFIIVTGEDEAEAHRVAESVKNTIQIITENN